MRIGRDDDVETFLCDWEHLLNQLDPRPGDKQLEHWLAARVKESLQLNHVVDNYQTNAMINQNYKSYEILWKTIQTYLVNKRLDRKQAQLENAVRTPRYSEHVFSYSSLPLPKLPRKRQRLSTLEKTWQM